MFRKMIVLAAVALSFSALANQTAIDTKGLSEAQIAEIKSIAAQKVAESAIRSQSPDMAAEKITAGVTLAATWGGQAAAAAEGFARAMGIAAKELNVTVNEFLVSPAGIITASLIIWKIAGASIASMLFGILVLIIGLSIARVLYLRLFTKEYVKVEYSRFGGLFTGTHLIRVPKTVAELTTEGEWGVLWVIILLVAITLLVAGLTF